MARRKAGAPDEPRRIAGKPDKDRPDATERSQQSDDAAGEVLADLDELSETKRERDEYLELAQRTKADFENYRKRVGAEGEEARKRAKADFAAKLIPAIDNLERALQAAGIDPNQPGSNGSDDSLAHGVLLVYRELTGALEDAGVERYDPAGERFDPTWHEALSTRPATEGEDSGVVVETVAKGYRSDGRVLRPARVVVSE